MGDDQRLVFRLSSGKAALFAAGVGAAFAGRAALRAAANPIIAGEVALVTGGSRGLGFLIARELAREGCRLVICARDTEELRRAKRDLEQEGAEVLALQCDVSEQDQVERMVAEATRHFGRIEILVNNAGIIQVGPLEALTLHDFQQAMDVMYWGVVYATLAVLPQMRERKSGRIVTITSIGGIVSVPHLLPYGAAKFAAEGFSEGLHAELAQEGISVTTIAPGLMRTGGHLNATFKGRMSREFTWMSLMSNLPGISMDAERAARQVVEAAKRGEAHRVLSVPARMLAIFQGPFPGTTSNLFGLFNRFILPPPGGDPREILRGKEVEARWRSPMRDRLTAMGRKAGRRFHAFPGPVTARTKETLAHDEAAR